MGSAACGVCMRERGGLDRWVGRLGQIAGLLADLLAELAQRL
ncbi:hypothetical protein BZL29_7820 [Mycobacterium kansasii]|uniref:Uncharacterized protein n=1 Tax=Mycobacterium kansasii TaxID=1768 RepID=A0A1V3WEE6_MYCKA|nr:hypothetical protein BZL29_7820 [Mycobacterium kansasii]